MDVSEYRRRYEEQLAAAEPPFADDERGGSGASVVFDHGESEAARIAALQPLTVEIGGQPELIDQLIALLRDQEEPVALRKAVLSVLQQAAFLGRVFTPKRPDYLDALRSLVDDPDAELRRRAIGILAREKDEYVQRRLIAGLEGREKPLVPAAKAIQFLGYDIHAEHFPLLRRIVDDPPSAAAKREAIRLLAADPKSRPMLTRLYRDKGERTDVRSVSAVALQSLAPEAFEGVARKIALDDDEDARLRVTSLNALTHFSTAPADPKERTFARRVEALGERSSSSAQMKRATKSYIAKSGG